MSIYTFGYYGKSLEDFKTEVDLLDLVVLDIRLVPQSRFTPQWAKSNLQNLFGANYVHVKELGNKAFKEKRIEILDLDIGLEIVKAHLPGVVLLCACKYYDKCHRKAVAEPLRAQGYEVKELEL
jgi:uncharacterized protein (DUF488 family)